MAPSDGKRQVWIIPEDAAPVLPENSGPEAPGHRLQAAPLVTRRRKPEPKPLRLLARAYGLGPLGTLLGRSQTQDQIVASFALAAGLAWLVLQLPPVAAHVAPGLRLTASAVCAVIFLLAWCRELRLAAGDRRFLPEKLPGWMRSMPAVVGLGLLVPGLGLMVAGRVRRAALALLGAGLTVHALVVLSGFLRFQNVDLGLRARTPLPLSMELWLGGTVIAAALGLLFWVGTALDGARLLGTAERRPRTVPADRYGLALLLALAIFGAGFRPAEFARDLDSLSTALEDRGFRHLPLALDLAALQLDSGRPEYAFHAASLAESTDRDVLAAALRYDVRERWQACATLFDRPASRRTMDLREGLIGPQLPR
jgi:hypothetical protein